MPFLIGWFARLPLIVLRTQLNSKLPQQFLLHFGGRSTHRIDACLVLREGDHVAQVLLAPEGHEHALDPERDAAVRGRAHRERVQQEPELAPLLLRRELERVEDARLELLLVDPERAAADLDAVDDEVVGVGDRRAGTARDELLRAGRRPRERMVDGRPARLVLFPLEHREVGYPDEAPGALVDQAELAAEMEAERPEHPRRDRRLAGREEDRGAGLAAEERELVLGEELGDRRTHLAVLRVDEVGEPLRPPLLRNLLEALELRARERLRHADEADGRCLPEDAELRAACGLGRVLDLEPEAQVGLVASEARLRLGVGHALERRRELVADPLAPDCGAHPLHEREEELLVGERHLDVELRDLLDAVGAKILVPEADGDLVIAVEAADHEQLLEDLRRLREREEPALLQAARDDEVARPFRRRLEEDRRLDVEEAVGLHLAADDRDHLRPERQVALHPRPAQVEPAVAQAQRLVDVFLVELERERGRARDDLELLDLELDLARGQLRVDVLGRPPHDLALGAQDELVANRVRRLDGARCQLRVDHELADPRAVAQVDEDEAAVVAPAVRPAGERQLLADVLGSDFAAHEVAPDHASNSMISSGDSTGTSSWPGRRSTCPLSSTTSVPRAPRRFAWVSWPLSDREAYSVSARSPRSRSSISQGRISRRRARSSKAMKTSTPATSASAVLDAAMRSTPAAQPMPGVGSPPSSSIR